MVHRTHKLRLLGAAVVLASFAASTAPAQAQESITIQLDGAAVPYYLPMYVAEHYGYFEDQGLDVEFLYAGAADILSNIGVGNVEIGFPNGDAVIAARANGLPVRVIHTTYQNGIGATLFKAESGIEGPEDLVGRTVAVTSYGSPNYLQLQVMMSQTGHSVDDVDVEIVGTGAILDVLKSDQVDAIVFSMLRYYNLQAEGIDVGMIRSDDFLPSKGNVLVTSEAYLDENPEVVAGVIAALNQAIEHIIEGDVLEEVTLVIEEYTPTFSDQEELIAEIISEVFVETLWQSEDTAAHEPGYGNLEAWQTTVDTLADYEIIPQAFDAADLVVVEPSSIE